MLSPSPLPLSLTLTLSPFSTSIASRWLYLLYWTSKWTIDLEIKIEAGGWGYRPVMRYLLSIDEALGSISSSKASWRKKDFFHLVASSLLWWDIVARIPGRNLQAGRWSRGDRGRLLSSLLLLACSACFLIQSRSQVQANVVTNFGIFVSLKNS